MVKGNIEKGIAKADVVCCHCRGILLKGFSCFIVTRGNGSKRYLCSECEEVLMRLTKVKLERSKLQVEKEGGYLSYLDDIIKLEDRWFSRDNINDGKYVK